MGKETKLIWFDFDNAPHVPVLLPIVKEMRKRGYKTILTARDKSETKGLLFLNDEKFKVIGKSFPKSKVLKLLFTLNRVVKLIFYLYKQINGKKILSVNHSSRSALLASWIKRIPSVALYDYEYVNSTFQNLFATKVLMPNVFNMDQLKKAGVRINNLAFYPGIKEQIYINSNIKKTNLLSELGIDNSKIIIIFRPPATTGHYHNAMSEIIMDEILNKMAQEKEKIFLIILPRTEEQKKNISNFFRENKIPFLIPERPLNGIDLILSSDLVLSGGGTMIREAAVIGMPSYSFFQGPKGAVDEFLEKNGRLIFIDSILDIENLHFEKKQKEMNILQGNQKKIISSICDRLESLTT